MFNISKPVKGLALLGIGLVLFLHTTGIITRGLDMVIILGSLFAMFYGFSEMDGPEKLKRVLHRK